MNQNTGKQVFPWIRALLLLGGLLFPFFSLGLTRVGARTNYWILQESLIPWTLFLLPIFFLGILHLFPPKKSPSPSDSPWSLFRSLSLSGTPLVFFLIFLSLVSWQMEAYLEDFGSLYLEPGFWFLLLSSFVPTGRKTKKFKEGLVLFTLALITILILWTTLGFHSWGIVQEGINQGSRIIGETLGHLKITFISLGLGFLVALPGAFLAYSRKSLKKFILGLSGGFQTIPSIALFGLLIAPLAFLSRNFPFLRQLGLRGIGEFPAIIALSLYAAYPILTQCLNGLEKTPQALIDASRGMGMSRFQLFTMVLFPQIRGALFLGLRIALIQTLGNAVLAALIGGGGLGTFIFEGLGSLSYNTILLGIVLVALLTLICSAALSLIARLLPLPGPRHPVPEGLD